MCPLRAPRLRVGIDGIRQSNAAGLSEIIAHDLGPRKRTAAAGYDRFGGH
jgi:hypothetical protein